MDVRKRQEVAAAEILTLIQISSEAMSRATALSIKAFGDSAGEALDSLHLKLYRTAVLEQLNNAKQLPNSTAFSVISCLDPLLAESMFECEPDELFLRPHAPAPLDPICISNIRKASRNALQIKNELYRDITEQAASAPVNVKELWCKRELVLREEDHECEELKQLH
jgi:hypothetical protein